MNGKELAFSLKRGDYVYGTAILSPSTVWPKIVASLGIDFVFIDTEHTPLNRETVSGMCQVYSARNLAPLVRIPSPDPYQATMALDGGATGIIAPYIETAEQVRQLVGAVKYKPVKGEKLKNMIDQTDPFNSSLSDYVNQQNQQNVLIANIESVAAINALDDILSIDGLDAVLVGPHDLSCSLDIPEQYHHSLFKQSVETIIEKARNHNVGVGIHIWEAVGFENEISWAKKGANFIVHSSDINIFRAGLGKELGRIKNALDGSEFKRDNQSFNI